MLDFLYTAVSWVLLRWHDLFSALGLSPGGGLGWTLSIVAVVFTARLLLLPLFLRARAEGAAFVGCLSLLASVPIFLALVHVLRHVWNAAAPCAAGGSGSLVRLYSFTAVQTCQAGQAKLFGVPLAATLGHPASWAAVALLLVVVTISVLAIIGTQRLAHARATVAASGSASVAQRIVRVVGPGSVVMSAAFLPLGVVVYLMTTNVWTFAQQAYLSR